MPRNPEEDRLSPEEREDRERQMTFSAPVDAMKQAPTPGPLSQIPTDLVADTMNVMARAYERIHSMPRISDTELAIKVGEAKERLRPFLAPTAPVEASGVEREPFEPIEHPLYNVSEPARRQLIRAAGWIEKEAYDASGNDDPEDEGLDEAARFLRDTFDLSDDALKIVRNASDEIVSIGDLRPQPSGETRSFVMIAEDAPVWADGIVTDGERVAMAQKAEADYGGTYWATDYGGGGVVEWEPTHFIDLDAFLSARPAPVAETAGEIGRNAPRRLSDEC